MVTGRSGTSRRARWAIASLAMASLLFGALAAGLGNLHASQQVAVGLPFAFTLLAGVTYELRSRTQHRQDGAQSAALASTEIARELRTLVKYRGLRRNSGSRPPASPASRLRAPPCRGLPMCRVLSTRSSNAACATWRRNPMEIGPGLCCS